MAAILETHGLTKDYRHQWTWRPFRVLEDVNLCVEEGEIFGLIGPNGAGKTTTFKLLLGLLRPTSGQITFCGGPLDTPARAAIGFLPEQSYFYDCLSVRETLDLYARLHGIAAAARRRRVDEVIEQVHLGPKRRAPLRTLSKGTLQRVGIAQAIINRPRLVILDEPMSGLDPAGRHHMRELIRSQRDAGTTVIFSSHILPDAEALCSRVGILAGGRLREVMYTQGDSGVEAYILTIGDVDADTLARLGAIAGAPTMAHGLDWRIQLRDAEMVRAALDVVRRGNGLIRSLVPVQPSLEERFLAYVGHGANLD